MLLHGIELVRSGLKWIVALALLISFGCFVFSLALADVYTQTAVLQGGRTLRANHATSFTPFYKEGAVSSTSPESIQLLAERIEQGQAYSAVLNNADVSGSESEMGEPIVLLFGNVVGDLYPDLNLCSPAPCAMRGGGAVGAVSGDLEFLGERIPIAGRLPKRATWFDPNSTGIPLAERTVIRLPPQDLVRLDEYAQEEVLTRTVMLRQPPAVVDRFVGTVQASDIYLVPSDLAVDQPQGFRDVVSRSGLYLAGFFTYLLLMFGVLSLSSNSLLQRESLRLHIFRMSGATRLHVYGSVGVFFGISIVFLPVLACLPLLLIGRSFAGAFGVVLLGCLMVWAAQTLGAIKSISAFEVKGPT